MSPNNAKQADVLEGAVVLPNANGTAPGQWLSGKFDGRERIVILLPGPPHELKALFEAECRERLRAKLPAAFLATGVLKVAMLGESQVDARVAPAERARLAALGHELVVQETTPGELPFSRVSAITRGVEGRVLATSATSS